MFSKLSLLLRDPKLAKKAIFLKKRNIFTFLSKIGILAILGPPGSRLDFENIKKRVSFLESASKSDLKKVGTSKNSIALFLQILEHLQVRK